MAVIVGKSASEETILLAFAESEIFSRRWAMGLSRHLPEVVAERARYSPLDDWSDGDRTAVLAAVRAYRPPLLEALLALRAEWFEATITAAELPVLYVATTRELRGLAPDGRLATLVEAVQAGKDTPDGEFSGAYRRLRNGFAVAQWHGRPCLAARAVEGPYTVLEGLTRLGVLLYRAQSEKPVPDATSVYVGITESLAAWGFACPAALGSSAPTTSEPPPEPGPSTSP